MKRLGLILLLSLGPACSTTARWETQLDQYRSGRVDPQPRRDRTGRFDPRTEEQKMSAQFGNAAGQAAGELAVRSLILLLAAL